MFSATPEGGLELKGSGISPATKLLLLFIILLIYLKFILDLGCEYRRYSTPHLHAPFSPYTYSSSYNNILHHTRPYPACVRART